MPDRPNVVFIMTDQWRGDCLGCYGHPVVETPHLDQLALQGTRFTQAYTATPSCIAARAGLFTGMCQRNHGRVGYRDGVPWNYEHTLAGEMAAGGYHTQAVGKMHVHPARNLMGFHNVVLHDGYLHFERKAHKNYDLVDDYMPWLRQKVGGDADMILHGLNCNSWVARPWPYHEEVHPTTYVTTMAIDFLRRRDPTKPFFLFVSYHRPHPPLDPPQAYFDQYIDQEFPPVPMGDWADQQAQMKGVDGSYGLGFMGERQLHRARAAYYAQLTHIDHQVGRLIEYLLEHDVLKDTMFVFTSDHGELLGDHNLFRKVLPYDGSARIPLIVTPPANWQCKRGSVSSAVVELRDIMPTILDACGVEIPDTVDGQSLLPLARGEQVEWREYLHGEHSAGTLSNHWITDGKHKYIWFSQTGREQFFDLANDPQELHDRIDDADFEPQIQRCRQWLIEELTGREEGYTDGQRLITGRPVKQVLDAAAAQQAVRGP